MSNVKVVSIKVLTEDTLLSNRLPQISTKTFFKYIFYILIYYSNTLKPLGNKFM